MGYLTIITFKNNGLTNETSSEVITNLPTAF